ncbi:MAG TPA: hypothetical protein VLK23_16540 [Thermodesulfobacteriota bacterium]|nr:hypothetical protein [Thermodesulfobacteriota bacterium]
MKFLKPITSLILLFLFIFGASGCAYQAILLGVQAATVMADDSLDPVITGRPLYFRVPYEYWFKSGVDIEQLKQDYGECRCEEKRCMEERGYIWLTSRLTAKQFNQDYAECRAKGQEKSCMEERGYKMVR